MENLKNTRILVIDDEEQICNYVRFALEQEGCSVVTASNGKKAIEAYAAEKFDVIITDIAMPEKDGIDTIIELRETDSRVGIVAMSGVGASDKLLKLATTFEADTTLRKPFTVDELIVAVAEAKKKKNSSN